jgi:uncharacterized protein YyaL (SSP411 family)
MVTPEGGLSSSLDADSEGEEGRFYVWTLAEIRAALGEDTALFARFYDVSESGNWEGTNILNRLISGEAPPETEARLAPLRERLLERRAQRVRPGLDDKVLADWNGLMIAALVRAALMLDRPDWIDLARRAYRFVAETMSRDGRLGHSWRAGALVFPGFALDHAAMIRAALALYETAGERAFLDDAQRWRDVLLRDYADPDTGVLAMTAKDADRLVVRPRPTHDEAVPNANGVFADDMVRLAQHTGSADDRRLAEDLLAGLVGLARSAPVGHTSILNALHLHLRGLAIVVTGEGSEPLRTEALRVPYLERTVSALADPATLSGDHPAKEQALAGQGPRALICAGMRCSLPVTRAEDLRTRVREMRAGR